MLDSVEWINATSTVVGTKQLDSSMWFYQCHFVDDPVMPGVLQTEAMLQTIVTALCLKHQTQAKYCLINKSTVNFFDKIQGSGLLQVTANVDPEKVGMTAARASLHFNDRRVASGDFRYIRKNILNI